MDMSSWTQASSNFNLSTQLAEMKSICEDTEEMENDVVRAAAELNSLLWNYNPRFSTR